ncbi:DEAD/DEAH box helicase family protein, partial [Helcococcus ovis]
MNIFEKTNRYFTFSGSINKNEEFFSSSYITKLNKQKFIPKEATIDDEVGLRKPQIGALYAIQAHWTLSTDAATIVLPTGTGKSETMFATIISKNINRTLIVVPSKLLRDQTYDRAKRWGILNDIGCLDKNTICPNTLMLKSNTKDFESFKKVVSDANIIISTIALLDRMDITYKKYLSDSCDLLIVDEAHHVSSKTWSNFKMYFNKKKVLQFTATPFREDKKLVDGKIIYNFPMHMAIEQNYFQPINFISIEEYDDNKVDIEIAKKAVSILENDLKSNFKHILLVRANNIERAKQLYENIYSRYREYNPVLITSKTTKINREKFMKSIKNGDSKIVICVDMFGEGIDIPNLKIAALHDKFKSLPITLQFIGRFARSKTDLGNAKIIANIADVTFMNSLKDLYETDSDWNLLLPIKSEQNIQDKIELQELISGFKVNNTEIDLRQLRPKVSMRIFKYNNTENWNPFAWLNCFDSSKCQGFINEEEKMLIVIEPYKSFQGWTTQRNIESLNWNFYIVYWNVEKGYICINDTNHQLGNDLLKNVFDEKHLNQIKSEPIFRCLANINRLSLGTIGLNSAINGPIRYKMFAGIDVSQGIAESQKINSYKSNLFGVGYDGNGKISIGCSYKGKIWSRWVESISFWKNWCDNIMTKILDKKNDSRILDNLLIPNITNSLPESVAYRIDFDDSIVFSESKITIQTLAGVVNIDDCELN